MAIHPDPTRVAEYRRELRRYPTVRRLAFAAGVLASLLTHPLMCQDDCVRCHCRQLRQEAHSLFTALRS
jgi:hypothetical protein